MKKLFCVLYSRWLKHFVDEKTDPLVVALDFLFGSNCKYCMTVRALLAGCGLGLLGVSFILGAALVALAVALTFGERYWLCDINTDDPPKGNPDESK